MKIKYISVVICTLSGLLFLLNGDPAFSQVPWYQREVRTEAHDPTMIRDSRGVYTMMSTNNLLTIRQSENGTTWTNRGRIFNAMPAWIATSLGEQIANIWAPHIIFRDNRYWVYYCASSFGTNRSVIGVASNPTLDVNSPQYAWTDHGEVIKTGTSNNYNAIDPEIITDKQGRVWMSFGSWWTGIKIVEIDPATGKRLASNQTVYSIASRGGSGIEGPSIIEHNGYYYLFTAWDICCQGTTSTYRTMVGRSASITGPYVDRQGRSLMNNYAEQVLGTYGRYIGQGGGSAFQNGRRSYFTHHYYNAEENGAARIQAREIIWSDDGWPVITQPFLGRRLSMEAEHSLLLNSPISKSTTASNDEYISMTNADSRATFYINALSAGNYRLRIRYASTSAATQFIKVNSASETSVQFPSTNTNATFPESQIVFVDVTFKKGTNVIVLRKGTNSIQLDRIDLVRYANQDILSGTYEDGRNVGYQLPDSQSVRMLPNGHLLFENVDFGNGGNSVINYVFNGAGSGNLEVRIDGLTGTVFQNYAITSTSAQPAQSFATSSAISNVTGIHDVYVINKNTSGDFLLKLFKFGVAVNQPPVISITAPLNNASFTAPASITINATASDQDGSISTVEFYQGSTLLGSDNTAPYSFTWTNVAAASYSLTAKATDNKGAVAVTTPISIQVTAPNQSPLVNITSPLNAANFFTSSTITINANATDSDGSITSVEFFNGTVLLGSDATAPYSFIWNNVAAGTYTITAKATDNSGTVAIASVTISVSSLPSGSTLQAEAACAADGILNETLNQGFHETGYLNLNNAVGSSASYAVRIPAAASMILYLRYANASTTNRIMSLQVNGITQVPLIDFLSTGAWTSWNFAMVPITLSQGYNTIHLTSLTSEGAPNIDELHFNSSVLTAASCTPPQAPVVQITSPVNGSVYIATTYIIINANASDTDGSVSSVSFYNGTTLLGTDNSVPYSITWENVTEGTYSITAKAMDNEAMVGVSQVIAVKVNSNQPSVITITSPVHNNTVNGNKVTISGYVTDPDGTINKVEYLQGSTLLGTTTSSSFSFDWNDPGNGTHIITIRATDSNGGITSKDVSVTVNNMTTHVFSSSLKKNVQLFPNPFTESFSIKTSEEIRQIEILNLHGATVAEIDTLSPGQSVEAGQQLSEGSYVIMVQYASGRIETAKLIKIK